MFFVSEAGAIRLKLKSICGTSQWVRLASAPARACTGHTNLTVLYTAVVYATYGIFQFTASHRTH